MSNYIDWLNKACDVLLPSSTISPLSNTKILAAFFAIDNLWTTKIIVLSYIDWLNKACDVLVIFIEMNNFTVPDRDRKVRNLNILVIRFILELSWGHRWNFKWIMRQSATKSNILGVVTKCRKLTSRPLTSQIPNGTPSASNKGKIT